MNTTTHIIRTTLVAAAAATLAASCAPATGLRGAALLTPAGATAVAARAADHDAELVLDLVSRYRRGADADRQRLLAAAIVDESRAAGLDPLLVAAIVTHESSFRTRAVSSAGAVGLMQLRPFVARDVASRAAVEWDGHGTLHDPALNVRLGVRYLGELLERFDGDTAVALTAYNVGPTRVAYRINEGTYRGSRYAERVLDTWARLDAARETRRVASRDAVARS